MLVRVSARRHWQLCAASNDARLAQELFDRNGSRTGAASNGIDDGVAACGCPPRSLSALRTVRTVWPAAMRRNVVFDGGAPAAVRFEQLHNAFAIGSRAGLCHDAVNAVYRAGRTGSDETVYGIDDSADLSARNDARVAQIVVQYATALKAGET